MGSKPIKSAKTETITACLLSNDLKLKQTPAAQKIKPIIPNGAEMAKAIKTCIFNADKIPANKYIDGNSSQPYKTKYIGFSLCLIIQLFII